MKEIEDEKVPKEIMKSIGLNNTIRERTILKQIALIEMGASAYITEKSMREDFGITEDQLDRLKNCRRSDIDGFKRNFEEGKFRLSSEINERLKLTEALRLAAVTGDKAAVTEIQNLLQSLETFVPVRLMHQMWDLFKDINNDGVQQKVNNQAASTNIQIINSSMAEIDKIIAERKKIPVVEVVEEKKSEEIKEGGDL